MITLSGFHLNTINKLDLQKPIIFSFNFSWKTLISIKATYLKWWIAFLVYYTSLLASEIDVVTTIKVILKFIWSRSESPWCGCRGQQKVLYPFRHRDIELQSVVMLF